MDEHRRRTTSPGSYSVPRYCSVNTALPTVADPSPTLVQPLREHPIVCVVETYPQIICKFDLNLTYPQTEKLPPLPEEERELRRREWVRENIGVDEDVAAVSSASSSKNKSKTSKTSKASTTATSTAWIPGLPPFNTALTGKMNPFFGCDLRDTALLYALNFTYPWNQLAYKFDYLDIPYAVNPISENMLPHHWMNRTWRNVEVGTDPSPPSTSFLDELATNATKEGISMVWYSGNDDALTTHWSTEVVIQNTTFGGIQSFTVKPNTSWFDDAGLYAGVVRQERGWTYGLLYGAGHQTPVINPARSFAISSSATPTVGLIEPDTGIVHTQAQPASATDIPNILPDGVITGQADVHYKTQLVAWPSATFAA
ncbi:hypothetical protein C8R44DRAFT_742173 [Mycena epipterygia]|nr:hypothetical protein C8R44DRAFT_742173 [Mycena epipterygia]